MLNEFKIKSFTIELRYPPAYLIWDRSGVLWADIQKHFPAMTAVSAQPQQVVFNADNRWHMEVGLDRARLTDFTPSPEFDDKFDKFEAFFNRVIEYLQLTNFSRIGMRIDYAKSFNTEIEVYDYVRKALLKTDTPPKMFDVASNKVKSQIQVSVEDDELGCSFRLEGVSRTIDVPSSPEFQVVKSQSVTENFVLLLLDHYTVGTVLTDQLHLKDLVSRVRRATHRDADKMFKYLKVSS